ncbi:MAG TPA: hypothetical protein VKU01_24595 [Bryobacteraceae bacterium]|nr:hypothetical protein [Bryobacteraceae bacterium]
MTRYLLAVATAAVLFAGCIGLGYLWLVILDIQGPWDEAALGLIMLVWILGGVYVFARATGIPLRIAHRSRIISPAERKRREAAQQAYRQRRERCLARLRSDPGLYRLIPLAEKGRIFSEEQIAYYRNPAIYVTCPHLRPIEVAMRAGGIQTFLVNPENSNIIEADCLIEEKVLASKVGMGPEIIYVEVADQRDGPSANLFCRTCRGYIWTKHPWEAQASTPRFPRPI